MTNKEPGRVLDLGCGRAKQTGAIGMDSYIDTDADVVADIDAPNLPFIDSSFDQVVMIDTLEHVEDVINTLSEVGRILRDGGSVFVRVPHFSSLHAYSDFTHRHFFSADGLTHLAQGYPQYRHYAVSGFKLTYVRIRLWRAWRILGIEWFANRFTTLYEKLFAFRFPAMSMEFELTKGAKRVTKAKDR